MTKFCQYRRCLSFRMRRVSSYPLGFRANSEVPGSSLENSTLRLDCVLSLQVSLYSTNQNDR